MVSQGQGLGFCSGGVPSTSTLVPRTEFSCMLRASAVRRPRPACLLPSLPWEHRVPGVSPCGSEARDVLKRSLENEAYVEICLFLFPSQVTNSRNWGTSPLRPPASISSLLMNHNAVIHRAPAQEPHNQAPKCFCFVLNKFTTFVSCHIHSYLWPHVGCFSITSITEQRGAC